MIKNYKIYTNKNLEKKRLDRSIAVFFYYLFFFFQLIPIIMSGTFAGTIWYH